MSLFNKMPKTVDIQRDYYAMATVDGKEAEITMYGAIVRERPKDWFTGEPVEGNFIVLDEFLDDLEKIKGAKRITIRLNTLGGDVFAALPIHNRLRDLKAEVTAIVDGAAASAGALIMCAADHVKANAGSIIMVHRCSALLLGGYNADEMREMAEHLDTVDRAQAAIIRRKTGLSEREVMNMLKAETYMTGKEAQEKGFVDEVFDGAPLEIAASADHKALFVNGQRLDFITPFMNLPDNIPTYQQDPSAANASAKAAPPAAPEKDDEGGIIMAKTFDELKKENPELANSIFAEAKKMLAAEIQEAVAKERKRLQEIDEISAALDPELVEKAKYEEPCTAAELALRAVQVQAVKSKAFIEDLKADANASGVNGVTASPNVGDTTPDDEKKKVEAAVDAGVQAAKQAMKLVEG